MNLLEIEDDLGNRIVLTKERWSHSLKHEVPDLDIIEQCVRDPLEIRASKYDSETALYYISLVSEDYLCVVIQIEEGFILTAYKTDYIKEGELLWSRKK